jgi:hypothetical protein
VRPLVTPAASRRDAPRSSQLSQAALVLDPLGPAAPLPAMDDSPVVLRGRLRAAVDAGKADDILVLVEAYSARTMRAALRQ